MQAMKSAQPSGNVRRVLIVGDRPGPGAPKEEGYHHTPFYSLKNCSGWLNVLLEEAGIPEERLVWLNAADEKGRPTKSCLPRALDPLAIIALGGNAAKWLERECGVTTFTKVDHPQFHKRFKYGQPYPLIRLLKLTLSL